MKNKTIAVLCVLWLLVMVGVAASTGTLLLTNTSGKESNWVSEDERDMIERYSRLETVRRELAENYYLDVDENVLIEGAIEGMMASLNDPYAAYYTAEEMIQREKEMEDTYHGLGILLQINDEGRIEVLRVYKDSPAEKAGLKVGDCILRIDGQQLYGTNSCSLDETVALMKGEDGSVKRMEVLRGDEILKLNPICGDVNINNISWTVMENGLGYLNIFQFTGNALEGFVDAAESLKAADIKGLIIDLRNNPGGVLDQVVAICDELLPRGIVVYTEDRAGSRTDYYSDEKFWDVPLVVLVNRMSASAAEIFAASVQDYSRGTIVGTSTYGKGVVQNNIIFTDAGDGMRYTSSSYFTPNGRSIHGIGVTPDVVVESEGDYGAFSGEPDPKNDSQLRAAIEILNTDKGD